MPLDYNKYTEFLIHTIGFMAFLKDKSFFPRNTKLW